MNIRVRVAGLLLDVAALCAHAAGRIDPLPADVATRLMEPPIVQCPRCGAAGDAMGWLVRRPAGRRVD